MLLQSGREISWPLFSGNKANSSSLNILYSFLSNTSTKKKKMANISWQIPFPKYTFIKMIIKHLLKCGCFKTQFCSRLLGYTISKGTFFLKKENKEIEIIIWLSYLQAQQPMNTVLVLYTYHPVLHVSLLCCPN